MEELGVPGTGRGGPLAAAGAADAALAGELASASSFADRCAREALMNALTRVRERLEPPSAATVRSTAAAAASGDGVAPVAAASAAAPAGSGGVEGVESGGEGSGDGNGLPTGGGGINVVVSRTVSFDVPP